MYLGAITLVIEVITLGPQFNINIVYVDMYTYITILDITIWPIYTIQLLCMFDSLVGKRLFEYRMEHYHGIKVHSLLGYAKVD